MWMVMMHPLGAGAAVVHQWLQCGCHTDKRGRGGGLEARVRALPVSVRRKAETANTDKEMSLGDALIVTIYPHGLAGL